jgi:hypothetical protein
MLRPSTPADPTRVHVHAAPPNERQRPGDISVHEGFGETRYIPGPKHPASATDANTTVQAIAIRRFGT